MNSFILLNLQSDSKGGHYCHTNTYTYSCLCFIFNYIYRTLSGEAYEDQSQLTVDAIERVDVSLSFENLGEIAFNAFITFELPRNIFTHRQVLPQSVSIDFNNQPSIYLSIYLFIHLSIHLSIYLSIHLSIFSSIHLFIYPSLYLSILIYLSINQLIYYLSRL